VNIGDLYASAFMARNLAASLLLVKEKVAERSEDG